MATDIMNTGSIGEDFMKTKRKGFKYDSDGVFSSRQFVDDEKCNELLEYCENEGWSTPDVKGSDFSYCLIPYEPIWTGLYDALSEFVRNCNREIFLRKVDALEVPMYAIRYDVGGYRRKAMDFQNKSDRVLTFYIPLNDPEDYKGGVISFPGIEYDMPKWKGSLTIFPSQVPLQVDPIESGVFYVLVGRVLS